MRNCCRINLVWMQWRIENSFGSIEEICNNNYMIDVSDTNCLVNTTLNGKQFGFSSYNIDYFVNHLDDRSVTWINIQDWCGYMVFNTGVRYDNGKRRVWRSFKCNIIQVFDMLFDIWRMWIKRKSIWKRINKMIS